MFLKTHNKPLVPVCVCVFIAFLRHSNVELLFPFLTSLTHHRQSFNLKSFIVQPVIFDISASASHLWRPLVFVLLNGREFLWPWLMDFCPQKRQTTLLLFVLFSLQYGCWPLFKSLPVGQEQLVRCIGQPLQS